MNEVNPQQNKRPENFNSPVECIQLIKKSVYLIARGRLLDPNKPNQINWFTIGTGCVVAPNRMITAAHVLNAENSKNDLEKHKHGDLYYLIRCDDDGIWHFRYFTPELNKDLFLYPEVDLGIINLDEKFYEHTSKDDYIRIDPNFKNIGTGVSVLGYPLCKLDFLEADVNKPNLGNILLRTDSGVINCRYRPGGLAHFYEFTLAFNPGNSGGPIFDYRTGKLVSIVHGYKVIPIKVIEHTLSDQLKNTNGIKEYPNSTYLENVNAVYSLGYATPSFIEIFKKHNILD